MDSRSTEPRWFGHILPWHRTDDGSWAVEHRGVTHPLIKLTAHEAGQVGSRPGWHFAHHPDLPVAERGTPNTGRCGPRLGANLASARRMAEAWLLPGPERAATDTTPHFVLVISNAGAALPLPAGPTVRTITLGTAHEELRILARHPAATRHSDHLGVLMPQFDNRELGFYAAIGDHRGRTPLTNDPLPWRDAATLLARGLAELLTNQERTS
jgi:hypothetical protein